MNFNFFDYLTIVLTIVFLLATGLIAFKVSGKKSKKAKIIKYTAMVLFFAVLGFSLFVTWVVVGLWYNFPII